MEKINWSKLAIRDLNNIQDYIAIDSPLIGKKQLNVFLQKSFSWSYFPDKNDLSRKLKRP
jgi:hypothetical protein